jgi:hypothetical protein
MQALRVIGILSNLLLLLAICTPSGAAPSPEVANPFFRFAPDWMSSEAATQLNLGFEVLVPENVPAPLDGQPTVNAEEGFYSLYWVVTGGPPTFLQITGEVNGEIPDYSKYDRNNELVQNAEVNGVPAFHDLTPIYDLVYWKDGDVVYSVESRNLTDDDSMGIAGRLVSLEGDSATSHDPTNDPSESNTPNLVVPDQARSGETVSIGVWGIDGATLSADSGAFTETGNAVYQNIGDAEVTWVAPTVSENTSVLFVVADGETGEWLTWENMPLLAAPDSGDPVNESNVQKEQSAPLSLDCPGSVQSSGRMEFVLSGSGYAIVDAGDGEFPLESPNDQFSPAGGSGRTLVGTVPDSGSIALEWIAPEVAEPITVYLFATTELGETTGECAVEVTSASLEETSGSSADPQLGEESEQADVVAASVDQPDTNDDDSQQQESNDETAPTKESKGRRKETPTQVVNEVSGLPTPGSDEGGEGEASGPTPTVNRTPTVRPTATIAPTTSEDGSVASLVGPEGGTLSSPLGATLIVPEGALTETSTVSIQPVSDTKLPAENEVDLVPRSGFDVTLAGPDGRAIENISKPAELRIELDEQHVQEGVRLYRVEGSELVVLPNTRIDGNTLVTTVDQFSRFVAGMPAPAAASNSRNFLPFALAGIVVVLVMIGMIVLGGMFRPRRQRVVMTRRPPRQRSRYR